MWGHPDQTEGPAAFVEKRQPRWQPLTPAATSDTGLTGEAHE
jgi:hypothetical protein